MNAEEDRAQDHQNYYLQQAVGRAAQRLAEEHRALVERGDQNLL